MEHVSRFLTVQWEKGNQTSSVQAIIPRGEPQFEKTVLDHLVRQITHVYHLHDYWPTWQVVEHVTPA